MRNRNSFWGILGREESEAPPVVVDGVRKAMLLVLEQHRIPVENQEQDRLEFSLLFATGLAELWYLRPELMQVVARHRGDAQAQQIMRAITALFDGYKHH